MRQRNINDKFSFDDKVMHVAIVSEMGRKNRNK